jgi:hypothetical protein
MSAMATMFRQWKSQLTKYIYSKPADNIPRPDYRGIDDETWEKFVQIRLSPEWQVSLVILK